MTLCEWDAPEGHPGQCCIHMYAFISYRRLSPQFQFSLSCYSRYLSRWVCLCKVTRMCLIANIQTGGARAWDESSRKLFAYSRSGGRLTQSFLVNETEEPAEEMFILYVKQTEIFRRQTSGYAGIANISLPSEHDNGTLT
jgi:hypothetical protein